MLIDFFKAINEETEALDETTFFKKVKVCIFYLLKIKIISSFFFLTIKRI